MVEGFKATMKLLRTDPDFAAALVKFRPQFPAIECPEDYKDGISALCEEETLSAFLDMHRGALGKKTLRQLLEEKAFERIERFIINFTTVRIDGPGAL